MAQKTRAEELQEGWENTDGAFYHQGLPFLPEVIRTKLISRHRDDLLAGHFGFDKT